MNRREMLQHGALAVLPLVLDRPERPEVVEVEWRDGTRMQYRVRDGVLEARRRQWRYDFRPDRRHETWGDWVTANHTVETIRELARLVR